MNNKRIRTMPLDEARRLLGIGDRWRATMGQRTTSVLHLWVHITGQGPLHNLGETFCGRVLAYTARTDWENIVTTRRCPVCAQKLALIEQRTQKISTSDLPTGLDKAR